MKNFRLIIGLICSIYLFSLTTIRADTLVSPNLPDLAGLGKLTFRIFGDREGLPQNTVTTATVDAQGYLWVGTQDGAAYYNGRVWTPVTPPKAANSNYIRAILGATDGSIWFGKNDGGLFRLKDGQWTTWDKNTGFPFNRINSLLETTASDGHSIIWAGTHGGGLVKIEGDHWSVLDISKGLPNNRVWGLLASVDVHNHQGLWICTDGGLARWQDEVWTIYDTKTGLPSNSVSNVLETKAPDGTPILWVSTFEGGLARLEKGQWTIYNTQSGLPGNNLTSLIETQDLNGRSTIWVGSFGGLAKFEQGHWTTFNSNNATLPGDRVYSLFKTTSKDGISTLWIGFAGGLARFKVDRWPTLDNQSGLPNSWVNDCLSTTTRDGTPVYWIATLGGLARYQQGQWTTFDSRNGLPNSQVIALGESHNLQGDPIIWVGTGDGLAMWQNNQWTTYKIADGLPNNLITTIAPFSHPDGTYGVWVGTREGLAYWDSTKRHWDSYTAQNSGLPANRVNSILISTTSTGQESIWIGTDMGLVHLVDNKWQTYNAQSGLINSSVLSVSETTEDNGHKLLWVGTRAGISLLNLSLSDGQWTILTKDSKPSLPSNIVYKILASPDRSIYLLTDRGVARLTRRVATVEDPAIFNITTYTTEDGLPNNQCNPAATIDKEQRLWVGTIGGLTMIDPKQQVGEKIAKPLVIERVILSPQANPQQWRLAQLTQTPLAYYQNRISFEYALLNYYREGETRYRTQLEDLDRLPTDWKLDAKVDYTNLSAGHHVFKLWAKDYAGSISGPIVVEFTIKAAPWNTWWAYTGYLGGLTGLIYWGIRWRLQALQRRNLILAAKVQERTNELDQKNMELDRKNEELAEKVQELAQKNQALVSSREELIKSYKQTDLIFSALSDILPGMILDSKYRLDSKIGSGGFGTVYRATHLGLERPVAVKIFRPSPDNVSHEAWERFKLEGISACRVNHPNAITILDSGVTEKGIAYLVMELLEGHTLTLELLKGRMPLKRAIEIIVSVCNALAEADKAGIIHRDIKPDNIFLHRAKDGFIVKVVDFGIAKLSNEDTFYQQNAPVTTAGQLIGTPAYIAPERFGTQPYDGLSDIYSLGIIFYQMLCGRMPFTTLQGQSASIMAIITMHLHQSPVPPRELFEDINPEVEELLLRMLAKDPQFRPNAQQVAQKLTTVIDNFALNQSGVIQVELDEYVIDYQSAEKTTEEDITRKVMSENPSLTENITRVQELERS